MKKIILICTPLTFYSRNDENAFFEWLNKFSCIEKYEGIGRELHLYISRKRISRVNLRDLFAVFKRYHFDNSQLDVFKNETNMLFFEK